MTAPEWWRSDPDWLEAFEIYVNPPGDTPATRLVNSIRAAWQMHEIESLRAAPLNPPPTHPRRGTP